MISNNALSVFFLHHHLNGLRNKNIHSIQDGMRASEAAVEKYKRVCEDFPNLTILTKNARPGEIQLTFGHTAVGNKFHGKSIVASALAGDIRSPSLISQNIKISFAVDSDKIHLPIAEVLFHAPPATSSALRIRGTGLRATPSSSRHFSQRPRSSTGSRTRASS